MKNETYFELMSKLVEVKNLWNSVIVKLDEQADQEVEDKAA